MIDERFVAQVKEDRQWHRSLRIKHARYRFDTASTPEEKDFWTRVLEINGDDYAESD